MISEIRNLFIKEAKGLLDDFKALASDEDIVEQYMTMLVNHILKVSPIFYTTAEGVKLAYAGYNASANTRMIVDKLLFNWRSHLTIDEYNGFLFSLSNALEVNTNKVSGITNALAVHLPKRDQITELLITNPVLVCFVMLTLTSIEVLGKTK